MKFMLAAALVLLQLVTSSAAFSCNPNRPTGEVILTIDGLIGKCNGSFEIHYDRAMLAALPRKQVRTATPWDKGVVSYEGVLLRDLLKDAEASGDVMTISALNDYHADIDVSDTAKYDVILADTRDGAEMPVRDKGPLFVVFPFTDVPELAVESRYGQSVWQVNRITVK